MTLSNMTQGKSFNKEFLEASVTSIDDRGYIYLTDIVRNIGNGSALIEKRLVSKIQ